MKLGGILSPQLFVVYVDELSYLLLNSKIECHIESTYYILPSINHIIYADDIRLFTPPPTAYKKYLIYVNNLDDLIVLLLIH